MPSGLHAPTPRGTPPPPPNRSHSPTPQVSNDSLPMACPGNAPVFVDTSLGTHLAFTVQPDITAADFKSRLGQEHYACFQNLGEIKVHALAVKRKSCLYHLPDSMPIRIACQGLVGSWFLFVDVSRLQSMPGQQTSSCRTSQELPSSKRIRDGSDKSRDVMVTQGSLSRVTEDLLCDDATDAIGLSNSGNIMTNRGKNMKHQADKCVTDHLMHKEDPKEVFSVPISSKKKRKSAVGSAERVGGTPEDTVMGKVASAKGGYKEIVSNLNTEDETRAKHNIIMDDSPFLAKNVMNLQPEHQLESNKLNGSSSTRATPSTSPSEDLSVTGIISNYFPDYVEVSSCIRMPPEDIQKFEETDQNEIICCGIATTELSADQKYPKKTEICDSSTAYSSNTSPSNGKKFQNYLECRKYVNLKKNEITTSGKERPAVGTTKKSERNTSMLVSDYQACQATDKSVMNNNERSKRRINKKVILNTPPSTQKMFSHPPQVNKQMEASSLRADRYGVGKRLVQAAKNIGLSLHEERLQRSMCIPMSGFQSMAKSTFVVRNTTFEISESND